MAKNLFSIFRFFLSEYANIRSKSLEKLIFNPYLTLFGWFLLFWRQRGHFTHIFKFFLTTLFWCICRTCFCCLSKLLDIYLVPHSNSLIVQTIITFTTTCLLLCTVPQVSFRTSAQSVCQPISERCASKFLTNEQQIRTKSLETV